MARKRMVDPHIWESFSFAELSDLAKILFISLISHADDEGRGIAGAAYIRNMTFPHDETRRVAEVQKALSEIALHTSTQFYQVDGREYYCLLNWTDYQKVDKPSKSKLPPPPSVGEGGAILSRQSFGEGSGNIQGTLGEGSGNKDNRIEFNINNSLSPGARTSESTVSPLQRFLERWGVSANAIGNYRGGKMAEIDWAKLSEKVEQSTFLQKQKAISFFIDHYEKILDGAYDDWDDSGGGTRDKRKPLVDTTDPDFDISGLDKIHYD